MARTRENQNRLLSQRIVEQLEQRILERAYPPGTHLAEDEIAADLGTSRTPVREAFRMLHQAGWLELQPHAGAFVRTPSMEEIRQVFEVRQCLEERAAALAAARILSGDVDKLRRIIESGRREVLRGNEKQITALNAAFHAGVAGAGRNQILERLLEDLGKHARWHSSTVTVLRGESSWREHEEILDAIERGDVEASGRLAVEHARRTQEAFFLQFIGSTEERTDGSNSGDGARSQTRVRR